MSEALAMGMGTAICCDVCGRVIDHITPTTMGGEAQRLLDEGGLYADRTLCWRCFAKEKTGGEQA
jgi:hypothetical protein